MNSRRCRALDVIGFSPAAGSGHGDAAWRDGTPYVAGLAENSAGRR
jgi:hypothetical protein